VEVNAAAAVDVVVTVVVTVVATVVKDVVVAEVEAATSAVPVKVVPRVVPMKLLVATTTGGDVSAINVYLAHNLTSDLFS
jgi:hypothetical protein